MTPAELQQLLITRAPDSPVDVISFPVSWRDVRLGFGG